MMFPLVTDLAADRIPVAVTCRVLGFSKQAFYQWRAHPVSQRDWDDAHLINAAVDIHHDDPEFGYRFITDELAEHGVIASRNRVNRLCTQQRLSSVHARKRGLSRRPGPPVHAGTEHSTGRLTEPFGGEPGPTPDLSPRRGRGHCPLAGLMLAAGSGPSRGNAQFPLIPNDLDGILGD
jgi:hypothetical protein